MTAVTGVREASTTAAAGTELTLPRAARVFFRYPTPWVLCAYVTAALSTRAWLGHWTWSDAVVVGALLAAQPLVEWVTHITLLHWKPRQVGPLRLDPYVSRKHRAHHRAPRDIPLVFIPGRVLLVSSVGLFAIYSLLMPTRELAVMALVTSSCTTLSYEWIHYLIHSDYRPQRYVFRQVHRAHWLHHFKNERYWFGVTSTFADHLLRTFPQRDCVQTSPTARTLGVLDPT